MGQGLRRLAGDGPRSLVRAGPAGPRQGTYTFRPAGQEQRVELSDSLVNSPRPVNRPVCFGPMSGYEPSPQPERSGSAVGRLAPLTVHPLLSISCGSIVSCAKHLAVLKSSNILLLSRHLVSRRATHMACSREIAVSASLTNRASSTSVPTCWARAAINDNSCAANPYACASS